MRFHLTKFIVLLLTFFSFACEQRSPQENKTTDSPVAKDSTSHNFYVPARKITQGPQHHWFGYYDKLEFDPTNRYVLSNQVVFEGRSPKEDDMIKVGMVDLQNNDQWIELGESKAWNWQQGSMLQFIPGSTNEVIWNDRQKGKFVSHLKNIESGEIRTLPFPIYTLHPDGKQALSVDFERINDTRPGYGYAGIPDPNKNVMTPGDAGIYLANLETGEKKLIISIADMMKLPLPESDEASFEDYKTKKHWFNHLLFSPSGDRFIFLHRWESPSKSNVGGFGTLMYTADISGKDIRLVDASGYSSHFIWQDDKHILVWTKLNDKGGFYLFEDSEGNNVELLGEGIMTVNGHQSYLPGNKWLVNDTYPDESRYQHLYLFNVETNEKIPLSDLYLAPEYKGEWRVDTHPRFSRDGKFIVVDGQDKNEGRQLFLMEIDHLIDPI
ncbi:hypothetical protein BH23BAC1_BH23BAC1_23970 [soil metagenome]